MVKSKMKTFWGVHKSSGYFVFSLEIVGSFDGIEDDDLKVCLIN